MQGNAVKMIFAISATVLLVALFAGAVMPANAQGPDCAQTYIVKRGDYLAKIARQYSQDPKAYLEIYQATRKAAQSDRSFARLFIPHYIVAGQKLCIPASLVAQAPASAPATGVATGVVTGTVTYLERIALPPNALVTVQLVEPGGAAGPVVLEERFIYSVGRQVPIPFEIKYDSNEIKPDAGYAVQATITSGGQVTFRSAQPVPVITGGNPTGNVQIMVTPVAGGASQQPPATSTAVVTGTVTYLERIAMPPNAVVTVRLLDESKTGAREVALGETTFVTAGKQPPYPFGIEYDPGRIVPGGLYTIEATITVDGRLRYRTVEGYPVITNGVTSVDVVVEPFG